MNSLLETKWRKFRKRTKLFKYIPFVEFVLAAGSMAMGTPREHSDFDVIVGVRTGRMFTARFFSVLFFGLFGWRRKKDHDKNVDPKSVSDKICLSHFVTEGGFCLKPPYTDYWNRLYRVLVPLTGYEDRIKKFFDANSWMDPKREWVPDDKFIPMCGKFLKVVIEKILGGRLGDAIEAELKKVQVTRINAGVNDKFNHKPRIVCNDSEIELYHHTERGD